MDPVASLEKALGGFPWLVQTLAGVSPKDIERWHAERCPPLPLDAPGRWLVAREMFAHFVPSIGDELITMFLNGFVLPAGPLLLPEEERSVLFLWAPPMGRYPNGILNQVLLAVKRRNCVTDPSGEFLFADWKNTIDCRDATIVDFLIVPEIQ